MKIRYREILRRWQDSNYRIKDIVTRRLISLCYLTIDWINRSRVKSQMTYIEPKVVGMLRWIFVNRHFKGKSMYNDGTLAGLGSAENSSTLAAAMVVDFENARQDNRLPNSFPISAWTDQLSRYANYWDWYKGIPLEESKGTDEKGKPIFKYPLKINPMRGFAQKKASLLLGEFPERTGRAVNYTGRPKAILGDSPDKKSKETASFYAQIINQVWDQSNGNSLLLEHAQTCQFLGGAVFGISYYPDDKKNLIPLKVRGVYPNFFLPVWDPEDYFNLKECFIAYRIAARQVSLYTTNMPTNTPSSIYVEHWREDTVSMFIDNVPIVANGITYKDHEHHFGSVPFVYLPSIRSGNFLGDSFIPRVSSLVLEYNRALADQGDAVHLSARRTNFVANVSGAIKPITLSNGTVMYDLGVVAPQQHAPLVSTLEAPKWDGTFASYPVSIWDQMVREVGLGPVIFGEDEGSQRSALTVALRMFPATSEAKNQRGYWADGLKELALKMLDILANKGIEVSGNKVTKDHRKLVDLSPDFQPMIPRDAEQQLNTIAVRTGGQLPTMSQRKAIELFGDTDDVTGEIEQIRIEQEELVERNIESEIKAQQVEPDIVIPTTSSGVRDQSGVGT